MVVRLHSCAPHHQLGWPTSRVFTLNKKIVTTLSYASSVRTGEKKYYIAVGYTEPWKYYRGKLYHWYDMRFPIRIPGWKFVEQLCRKMGGEIRVLGFDDAPHRWRDRPIGWTINQDLRCDHLNAGQVQHIGNVQIDEETYDLLRSSPSKLKRKSI
jgi:hypothetical protein